MKIRTLTIISVLSIVLSIVFINEAFKYYLELSSRQTARYMLENTKNCVNELLKEEEQPIDAFKIEKALKTCAGKQRTTSTGDAFAFEANSKLFVFDPSRDCYLENKLMTIDSECTLHQDKLKCEEALRVLDRGYDSDENTMLSWKFDDGIEFIEFTILPDEYFGYDGVQRGGNKLPYQVVLAQGIQEDELLEKYKPLRLILFILGGLMIFLILVLFRCAEARYEQRTT